MGSIKHTHTKDRLKGHFPFHGSCKENLPDPDLHSSHILAHETNCEHDRSQQRGKSEGKTLCTTTYHNMPSPICPSHLRPLPFAIRATPGIIQELTEPNGVSYALPSLPRMVDSGWEGLLMWPVALPAVLIVPSCQVW